MRILFAGSPAIAVPALEKLARAAGHEVVGVLTNPDTPKGRHGSSEPTEVGAAAERLSAERVAAGRAPIPVLKPEKLAAEARTAIASLEPELLVSVAYGRIFGPKFLGLFPAGGINLHPSLLPKYRGATPIPAAILNRESETGITVQRLALEMDAGDILVQERLPLDFTETTASLAALAAARGAELVLRAVDALAAGTAEPVPQDGAAATYCAMIAKEDGRIDWTRSALDLDARIRAYTPWPLSFTTHRDQTLFILEARPYAGPVSFPPAPAGTVLGIDKAAGILLQTGDGLLAVVRLQYGGKKAMDWRSFLNGARDFSGSRLGADHEPAERAQSGGGN